MLYPAFLQPDRPESHWLRMTISDKTSFPPGDLKLGGVSGLVVLYIWGLSLPET